MVSLCLLYPYLFILSINLLIFFERQVKITITEVFSVLPYVSNRFYFINF